MKTILLKTVLIGLGSATAMNVLVLALPAQTLPALGNLPLYFTAASPSQANQTAQFIARGGDYQFLISPAEARLELQKPHAASGKMSVRTVRMQFVGAAAQAQIRGADELPGKINYLIGSNPAHWRTGVETFARLRVEQLYPGVNLVYYGNQRQLEYDLTLAPGANPDAIQIRFSGADKISIGGQGELILALDGDEIRQPAPVIYQMVHGQRRAVSGGYRLADAHTVAFAIGKYDGRLPLVIDPVLSFSTYFGGNSSDTAWSVALDTNGFIYIVGNTLSSQFPTNSRPFGYQTNFAGGGLTGDAFVAKFDNQGSNLIYLTYLGGSADDWASSIAVDSEGDAFVTGYTVSTDFPTSTNALYRNLAGPPTQAGYFIDAFVSELNPGGSNLIYSTYLGGAGMDAGNGIALDSSNNIYVIGFTSSTNFPTTTNAIQKYLACPYSIYTAYFNVNAFLTEISASGTNLLYSSYLGGTNFDAGEGIAIDNSNYVYVTGFTASTNFPTTNAIFQQFVQTNGVGINQVLTTNFVNGSLLNGATNLTSTYDAFVAKFTPSCTNLVYSTLLGGTDNDVAYHIAVDGSGNAYATGWTVSTNFPNTVTTSNLYNGLTNNLVYGYDVTTNVFLTQIAWSGSNAMIGFSTVFGGTNFGGDVGNGITLDTNNGNIFIVGTSTTTNFPAVNTPGLLGTTNAGGSDVFVIAFNTNCSSVLYSGYLGGLGDDFGYGIAVDSSTNVYIVGQTASANFPVFNAQQPTLDGPSDAFLAKIGSVDVPPQITPPPLTNQTAGVGSTLSLVVAATGTAPLTYQWQEQNTNLVWTNLLNGGNLSGATNATLTISSAQTTNSGSYQVIVTNYAGAVTSSVAVLTITNVAPVLTGQPQSQTVAVGSTNSFSVSGHDGTFPELFQWFKDGTALTNGGTNFSGSGVHISGATNASLTINDVQTNDDGTYWLTITNPWGLLTSSNATLTVVSFPTIVTPPTNQTVGLGSSLAFGVTAVGTATLSYQWQFDGMNLTDGTNANGSIIGGSTSTNLTINNAQTNNDGGYTVIVTNSLGSVTSAPPAVLTVLTAPRFTGVMTGTNGTFIFNGAGGTNGGTYLVLASTNLAIPLSQWTTILVSGSQFGSQGQFIFTNTPPANLPQRFYILELPPP